MFEQSETLQELWQVKQAIASEYATFRDFCKALIKRQDMVQHGIRDDKLMSCAVHGHAMS